MKKQPEVTERTRQKLIASFWNLLPEKGLDKITVSGIVKDACYNRSTFYEYFSDVYDLLNQVEDEMIDSLMEQISERFKDGLPKTLSTLSRECASIFIQFDDKLCYLLSAKGDPAFSSRFKNKFVSVMTKYFDLGDKNAYKEYILTFSYSAMIGLRLYWYENGKQLDFEEVIHITQALVATGALGFIGQKYFD